MTDIFISYARGDYEKIKPLAEALEAKGWSVWWDPQIQTGERFDRVIQKALAETRCVIVAWSQKSVESDWVRAEATMGFKRDILIPIIIDPSVEPPVPFNIIQTSFLIDWSGKKISPEFDKLIFSLEAMLGESPAQAEIEAKRKIEEELKRREIAEKQKAEEARKQKEAERRRKSEAQRRQKEAESRRIAEQSKKRGDAAAIRPGKHEPETSESEQSVQEEKRKKEKPPFKTEEFTEQIAPSRTFQEDDFGPVNTTIFKWIDAPAIFAFCGLLILLVVDFFCRLAGAPLQIYKLTTEIFGVTAILAAMIADRKEDLPCIAIYDLFGSKSRHGLRIAFVRIMKIAVYSASCLSTALFLNGLDKTKTTPSSGVEFIKWVVPCVFAIMVLYTFRQFFGGKKPKRSA